MEKRTFSSSLKKWKDIVKANQKCDSTAWNQFCKTLYTTLQKESDRSVLRSYLQESVVLLLLNCGNDELEIRCESEETLSKITHLCEDNKLLSYMSFIVVHTLKQPLTKRSIKLSLLVLSYSMEFIRQQKFKAFAQEIFSIVSDKCDLMAHPTCIESFADFFQIYITIFGSFLHEEKVLNFYQIFRKYIFSETSLVRHNLAQCVVRLDKNCVNHRRSLQNEILKCSSTFQQSTNENEIIGAAELLKYNVCIADYADYHEQLIRTIVESANKLNGHIGVINIVLELLTELFKFKNYSFHSLILMHTLENNNDSKILLVHYFSQIASSLFLYNEKDGSLRNDVLVSIQSNVIDFLTACADLDICVIASNIFLVKTVIQMAQHTDFIIREKAITFISRFINTDILGTEEKTQVFTTLASAFEDSAHTVLVALITQLNKSFNELLERPLNKQISVNDLPFTTYVMNKIISLVNLSHWLVLGKICEFYRTIDILTLRTHFGYSKSRFYQETCYKQLCNLLDFKDHRVRQGASKSIVKILKNLCGTDSHDRFLKHVTNYISNRYFFNHNIVHNRNVDNWEQISHILCMLCNNLAVSQDNRRIGNIICLANCISEIPQLLSFCSEYNLFNSILTLMIEDYSIAINVTLHINLLVIVQHILPGYTHNKSNMIQELNILKGHIFNILNIYVKICDNDPVETAFDGNLPSNMYLLKDSTSIYEKLYDVTKTTFESNRLSLNKSQNRKVFQLLYTAVETLSVLLNFFSVSSFLSPEDNTQLFIFCNILYKLIPIHSLNLLKQVINVNSLISYKTLNNELNFIFVEKTNSQFFCDLNVSLSKIETKVMNLKHERIQDLDKAVEKPLKQIVTKTIKQYAEMNAEEQNAVLELINTLMFSNFDYNSLDPEKLLLVKVLNQFEMIERSLSKMSNFASKSSIRFILLISLKNISSSISLSKVMNLVDSSLTNTDSSTGAITTICELLVFIFSNDFFSKIKDQTEINTLKEVLLHTLYKFDSNNEIVQTLLLIINNKFEPFIENLQKYVFGQILQHSSKNENYWYFMLLTLDCINAHFVLPKYWITFSIDKFMKSNFYELGCLFASGCWLNVILTVEYDVVFNLLQENDYLIEELDYRITTLFVQLFKKFDKNMENENVLFEYTSKLLLKLKNSNSSTYLKINNALHKDFNVMSCKNALQKNILNQFCLVVEDSQNIEFNQIKFSFVPTITLNIINFINKIQLEKLIFTQISIRDFVRIASSVVKNKRYTMDILLSISKNKNSPLLLALYTSKKCPSSLSNYNNISVPNTVELISMLGDDKIKMKRRNDMSRFMQFGGRKIYDFYSPEYLKSNNKENVQQFDKCECFNSIIAGAYMLEIKSAKTVADILKSDEIKLIYFNEWIQMCFNKIVFELRKLQNGLASKHLYIHLKTLVPPLLKIVMEKLFSSFNNLILTEGEVSDQEFFPTINAITCFFKSLHDVQLEAIGKIDLTLIEKIMDDVCLSRLDPKTIVESLFKTMEKKDTKLDEIELYTGFLNSVLNINFMWRKIEKYISVDSSLSKKVLFVLCRSDEQIIENLILKKVNHLINDDNSNGRCKNIICKEIFRHFLRMEPFYKCLYEVEHQSSTSPNRQSINISQNSLLDYNYLQIFVKRLNFFGFSNKYQYEQLFTSLLIAFNSDIDEYMLTPAEKFRFKKLILEALCNLITLCYRQPFIGKTDQICLHFPRIPTSCIDTIWLKKLQLIHCKSQNRKLRSVFSCPNLERSHKERQWYTFEFEKNQGITTQNLHSNLIEMNFDVDSSILLMIEALNERMSQNYMEVLPSISQLVEFRVTKDRFYNIISNINHIRETVSIHDTLTYQHIIYCFLKCLSFEPTEVTQSSNVIPILATCLKNKQMFLRLSTMHGLMAVFESFYVSKAVPEDEIALFYNSIMPYINKILGLFTYSEVHDRLLCEFNRFITYNDHTSETMNRYMEIDVKNTMRVELISCVLQSFESLLVHNINHEKTTRKLQQICLELTKEDNLEINLIALQTLITTIYANSSNQLEQTEEANGIVQTEIQSNSIVLEVVNRHFQLLRVASVAETPLIGLFLYHLVTDLSRPNDMLPLVIKEFLDCYNPYPFVIGKVVYGMFRSAIDANLLPFLQDFVLSVLPSILAINNKYDRIFRLTILFASASIDHSGAHVELNILNGSKPQLFHQNFLFATTAKDFYMRLKPIQRNTFLDICKPFKIKNNEIEMIYKICEVLQ